MKRTTQDEAGSGVDSASRVPHPEFASVLPFVTAVVSQAAVPLGLQASDAERAEREARVASLVRRVLAEADAVAAERLRAQPVLLAAFFQNIDLLYRHAYPRADQVALLVMRALEALDDTESARGLPPA